MNDLQILEIIKDKRKDCYCDYEFNLRLNMRDEDRQSFRARKEYIKVLKTRLNVYDELIYMLEYQIAQEKR